MIALFPGVSMADVGANRAISAAFEDTARDYPLQEITRYDKARYRGAVYEQKKPQIPQS